MMQLGRKSAEIDAATLRVLFGQTSTPSSTTDHGGTTGLLDDDHIRYMHISAARTVTAVHTFNPSTAGAPFTLGANAQDQLINGLNADLLDGAELATIQAEIDSDIATHTALANAHHALVTVTDTTSIDLTLSGQQVSGAVLPGGVDHDLLLNFVADEHVAHSTVTLTAGAGLTGGGDISAGRSFAVGAGDGITVSADSVALTTPGTLSVSSANAAAGSHTHAITSSADVGTTPAQSVLASTASGGLILATAEVKGNLDVTGGGDFTVGSNLLFADFSQLNVGINCAPDAQFALDVNGPIRGTYLIGPLARQINDALMVCQYDGAFPYETDFTGDLTGHMGQIGTPTGGVIFRPGKFDKAVQLAEAATNLITNPSFEIDTAGWSIISSATITQSTASAWIGDGSGLLAFSTTAHSGIGINHTTSAGGSYAAQAKIRNNSGGSGLLSAYLLMRILYTDASYDNFSVYCAAISDEWQTLEIVGAANGAKTVSVVQMMLRDSSTTAYSILVDGVQLTNTSYHVPYLDGSLGDGHSWSGTAHASASSRTQAYAHYDLEMKPNTSYSVGMWINTLDWSSESGHMWLAWYNNGDVANNQTLIYDNSGNDSIRMYNVGNGVSDYTDVVISPSDNAWYFLVYTLDHTTSEAKCYVNGVLIATDTFNTPNNYPDKLRIGGEGSSYATNGLIDNLFVTESAVDADTIRAVYESNAPVFAVTSTHSFRTASGAAAAWADEEGLWARATDGTAGFGFSAVDSKSWGGQTLNAGDVLLGSGNAVALWDVSSSSLSIGNLSAEYLKMDGSTLTFYNGATARAQLSGDTWTLGDTATEHVEITTTALNFNDGVKTLGSLSGSVWVIGNTSYEHIEITSSYLRFIDLATTYVDLGAGVLTLGPTTTDNIRISPVLGIQIRDGSTIRGNWQTDGDIFIGSDIAAAATTYFSIFATAQTYNAESMSAGDMLIGDNSASKANILWDKSAGQLLFRGGATTAAYIDTDGAITAGGGNTILDSDGLSLLAGTKVLANSVSWTFVGTELAFISADRLTMAHTMTIEVNDSGQAGASTTLYLNADTVDLGYVTVSGGDLMAPSVIATRGISIGSGASPSEDAALFAEASATPASPASGTQVNEYLRNGKLIYQYNDGGTVRYKYLDLTGTGVTWVHTTVAP